ncbi:sulfite oxidase heme-binding subunit YedZ [Granulosicoccus antarcticus]|uniref:Protein-methionine-sulfoxide reductase heme-binding subunit MsrQ n=1 Tax=Granulosicoccus antarcticus IMCC3135 TaxID=1192854 RepID=A0A2Z2NUA8_9GAMM|nr:protein-methionine-sulfoxide reductase heme-binding subunit MsrQ [Granulosicoccus antarcticus]ASJ74889.1 Protein-methionine-sulfoxide reductase heme-binding subunit MsrQ [Granulosicoccus antarcticus IMCC3135]
MSESIAATNRLGLPALRWQSILKPVVFVLALTPFVYLVQSLLTGGLGPNPIDALTDTTGTLAIRMLLISLCVTPLRGLLKKTWPLKLRRMLGLFAFFYVFLHVSIYLVLDQQLDVAAIWEDLAERPYILAGTMALLILIPLAGTSTRGMVKRLGKRWVSLHRGVYVAGAAAVVHYVWLAKGDLIEPFVYLAILIVLLGYRFVKLLR